jgi:hypothetical protein
MSQEDVAGGARPVACWYAQIRAPATVAGSEGVKVAATCILVAGYCTLERVSQPMSTTQSALVGAAAVAAGAAGGALVARSKEGSATFKGLATVGGGITGAAAAGLGGAVVALTSKRWRKPAIAAAALGLGGVSALLVGNMLYKALAPPATPTPLPVPGTTPSPSPGPGGNIVWTQIPATTTLQPQIVYRLSDVAAASDIQTPPTVDSLQAYLGPMGFEVDGVWTGTPPTGWPAADVVDPSSPRVYMEFWATKTGAQLPGLTSAARLFVQKASA